MARIQSFNRRVAGIEKNLIPTDQEIIDYLTSDDDHQTDYKAFARIDRAIPAYLKKMTNEELIALVLDGNQADETKQP